MPNVLDCLADTHFVQIVLANDMLIVRVRNSQSVRRRKVMANAHRRRPVINVPADAISDVCSTEKTKHFSRKNLIITNKLCTQRLLYDRIQSQKFEIIIYTHTPMHPQTI